MNYEVSRACRQLSKEMTCDVDTWNGGSFWPYLGRSFIRPFVIGGRGPAYSGPCCGPVLLPRNRKGIW